MSGLDLSNLDLSTIRLLEPRRPIGIRHEASTAIKLDLGDLSKVPAAYRLPTIIQSALAIGWSGREGRGAPERSGQQDRSGFQEYARSESKGRYDELCGPGRQHFEAEVLERFKRRSAPTRWWTPFDKTGANLVKSHRG